MAHKKEVFGISVISYPMPWMDHIVPFILWAAYYLLVCAAPMLIAAAPCELGPEIFSFVIVWRFISNGVLTYIAMGNLDRGHYLTQSFDGMHFYWFTLVGAFLGLTIFFKNCHKDFSISTFWMPVRGKEHVSRIWRDLNVWEKAYCYKGEEIWGWVSKMHPVYLPFDDMTAWLCEDLVAKYGHGGGGCLGGNESGVEIERADFLTSEFVTRIYTIYSWKKDLDEDVAMKVDAALKALFGGKVEEKCDSDSELELGLGEAKGKGKRSEDMYLTTLVRGRRLSAKKIKVG
eukprot:CAMPEP_0182510772 /NCGR_PEP_ID=MMETSP1321-20130603/29345_1 /TAXON_ID=91990 /ORGANISM="Bolidomonas sp., Strain RCC1657" /LENGTH=287 /DNA_ID=CAMNT_0024717303 /DNA_START=24 /DNA_END=883 /DNA_ORIENTATION=+